MLPLLSVFLLTVLSGLAFRPSGPLPQSLFKHFHSFFLGHSLPLGFILSFLSDCASAQLKELFRDEFDGQLFNTTGGKWVAGPFMYLPMPYRSCRRQEVEPLTPQCRPYSHRDTVAKINTTAQVLTFGVVPADNTIGAGDIFTKDRFKSKSGTCHLKPPSTDHSASLTQSGVGVVQGFFRLKFRFLGLPGCTRAFVGWYTMMPIRSDYNVRHSFLPVLRFYKN
jgi:hypothetical protein